MLGRANGLESRATIETIVVQLAKLVMFRGRLLEVGSETWRVDVRCWVTLTAWKAVRQWKRLSPSFPSWQRFAAGCLKWEVKLGEVTFVARSR
ncbi:hypothetical protein SH528x_003792 [Novipirellula sp. SH528]|uniref:hypothetical protein n=1 Tax=Novipirellula sp. SH528 TaxID=3454466 RepID=UPI003F9F38B2